MKNYISSEHRIAHSPKYHTRRLDTLSVTNVQNFSWFKKQCTGIVNPYV